MGKHIAIIGAGLAGLAAAIRLADGGGEVVVFEKSRGLSGRAASRSRRGCRYDFGANYFKISSNEVARLVFQTLPTDGLCRIVGDILPFDEAGKVLPGDAARNAESRWTYRDGISTLGKRIAATGRFRVETGTRITRLEQAGGRWQIEGEDGSFHEDFDAVILTPPAPQTADLLEASDLSDLPRDELIYALRRSDYHSQFSVVLNFPGELCLPGDAFALVNSDRGHDLAWLSLENRKAGHVPPGESLLVLQMSPLWSSRHYEDPVDQIVANALAEIRALLATELPDPSWSDTQRWRYAHPRSPVDLSRLKRASERGLFFAGDGLVGRGRLGETIETGFIAAAAILAGGL